MRIHRSLLTFGAVGLAAAITIPATAATKTAAKSQATTAPASCSKKGGNFVDNWNFASSNPQHLDPGLVSELIGAQVDNMLWDGLTRVDAYTGKTMPDVAESWKVSPDGLTWTFKIKKGIKFTTGEDVLPSTFKKSWERNDSAAFASDYSGLAEVIKNGKELLAGTASELGVVADDSAMTLDVQLAAPYGLLAERLTHNFFFPVPKEALDKGKDWENTGTLAGNGAFKIDKDQAIKVVRNDAYFGGIYGRPACLDSVTFKISKDQKVAYADFEAGNSSNGVVPVGQFSAATGKYGDRATRSFLQTTWIAFNWRNPEVGGISNSLLRSAIGNAVNRDAINKVVYDNSREVATGLTPDGIPGFKKGLTKNFQSGVPNLALAKKQIAQYIKSGKTIPNIHFWFRNNSTESIIAQLIQDDLKQIGVTLTLEPQVPTGYFGRARRENPQMFLNGWAWDYPGYDNGTNELFHSKDKYDTSNNISDFSAPTYDKLTDNALKEPNAAKQAQLYQQAEAFQLNSGVTVPLFHGRFQTVLAQNVDTYPESALGFVEFALVTLK